MLSPTFDAQARAIVYPAAQPGRAPEALATAISAYRAEHAAVTAAFAAALAEEYLAPIAESRRAPIAAQLFTLAWEAGHASGYSDVEYQYQTLAEFAVDVYTIATR